MDKRAEYTIGIKSEGLGNLTKVIEELEKAGVETSEFKREAALLRQQLAEMQQQQQLIDSFTKIKQETTGAAAAFEAAQQKAQQLGRELAATEAPTKKQASDFARAREAVNSTKDAYQAAQLRLQAMRSTLAENNIETAGLAQKQALLRNGVRDVETSVAAATARLRELGSAGPQAANATAAATDKAAASAKGYQGSLTQVAQAVAGLFAVNQIGGQAVAINQVADQYKNLEARVRLAVGAQTDLHAAIAGIAQVAKDTHSNLDATAELFGRLAATAKELGLSNAQALGVTKTINESIQVSGASAQASEAAVRQLVQALQSGVLRGDEFNSIMEQAPRLAKALADGLEVPVGALRGMAEAGELTAARVVKALKGQAEAINKEFASLPLTTGRALEDLRTQWTLFVGGLDAATNASSYVANGIAALAGHLDTIARVAGVAGAALTASLAVQGAAALRAYAVEATAAAGATNLLAASISRIPKVISITVAAVGFEVGYEIGEQLYQNSELARKLGVGINGFFQALVNDLVLLKDTAAAVFTDDTVAASFDRYIARGKELDAILTDMWKDASAAPGQVAGAADAGAGSLNKLGGAGTAAGQSIAAGASQGVAAIGQVSKAAEDARVALSGLSAAINSKPPPTTALADIVKDLTAAKLRGEDLDQLLRTKMPDAISKLSGTELVKFRADFIGAMDAAKSALQDAIDTKKPQAEIDALRAKVDSFERSMRTGLALIAEQAATKLGIDVPAAFGKMSQGFRESQDNLSILIRQLPELKVIGVDTAAVVGQALSNMINGAKNQAEIDAVIRRVETLRKELGDKIANGLLDQAKEKALELKDALDKATPGINSVREAMKALGITSDEELKKVATSAKEAYDTLVTSGKASARELSEGFKKAAEAAIAANNGIAPSWVTASATLRGYNVEVDAAGKSTLRLRDATNSSADAQGRANRATRDATTELERLNAVREREIAAQEKANQLKEREIALYLKKWNMDSQHRSLDADGKVREEVGMPTRKGVYDRAKTAGLSEEDALKFADSFDLNKLKDTGSRGTPFVNIQRLDDAINDAVLDAARRKAGGLEQSTPTQTTAPSSGGASVSTANGSSGMSQAPATANRLDGGATYVSNVSITGIGNASFRFASAGDQQAGEGLLRKLAQAKGASI